VTSLLALALLAAAPLVGPAVPAGEPASAADAGTGAPVSVEEALGRDEGRRTMGRLPANLGRGLIGVVNGDNLVPLIAGATVTGASTFLDDDVRESESEAFNWGQDFETAGGPVFSTVFVGGMFAAGRFAHGERFRAMTYDMLDAAVVNYAWTAALKAVAHRERPNGEDHKSFPSGHTSNAFALAAVAERHYGWKVGLPSYVLAGFMGLSRIEQDKHWLSDVVAGAGLGYIAGRTVVRVNSRSLERRAAIWNITPIVARHARGVRLSVRF
jgi:membrane-associated phospholipid phosphatase